MSFRLSVRRASQEYVWSLVIVAIFTAGLTTWTTIPSLAYSTDSALNAYANTESTFVVVSSTPVSAVAGVPGVNLSFPVLPLVTVNQIMKMSGVERIYPMVINFTTQIMTGVPTSYFDASNNKTITHTNSTLYVNTESAVLGGPTGFPVDLLRPGLGRVPYLGEAAFMLNTIGGPSLQSGRGIPLNSNYTFSIAGKNLTMRYVGKNEVSPLFSSIPILFDQRFVQLHLGAALYNDTFGGKDGVDYIIIKAYSIQDVSSVVSQLQSLLSTSASSANFQIVYDQPAITALESFESGTEFEYVLVGAFSLGLAISLVLVVSYIGFKRRAWEVGLLISQGWNSRQVHRYLFYYVLILAVISALLATALSYVLLHYQVYTLPVYGSTLIVAPTLQLSTVLVAFSIAVIASFVSSWLVAGRISKQDLGNVLKEY